jgi:hypothetical protein
VLPRSMGATHLFFPPSTLTRIILGGNVTRSDEARVRSCVLGAHQSFRSGERAGWLEISEWSW